MLTIELHAHMAGTLTEVTYPAAWRRHAHYRAPVLTASKDTLAHYRAGVPYRGEHDEEPTELSLITAQMDDVLVVCSLPSYMHTLLARSLR